MDLKSGYPFWAVKNGLMQAFPPLQADLRCDVLVVGGGITGALIADELARVGGHDVALIEQRDIGWGSTAASTALLQYEIDTHMVDLAGRHGEDQAAAAYLACAAAIDRLREIARPFRDVDFHPMQSLYYASRRRDCKPLAREFAMRGRHGLAQRWLDAAALQQEFGIAAPAAILSAKAARVDPYRLTYRLLARLARAGARIHDRTTLDALTPRPRSVLARTGNGHAIVARHVVLATGYAAQTWLRRRVAANRSSYALITDPIDRDALGPLQDTMVWETARPYLYLRSTGDGRLLIGGEDDAVDIPARRDARVDARARRLLRRTRGLFPQLPLQPAFSWAGTFAETADGLPFFGPHAEYGPRVHFAMAYGGNGITYSAIGADLLRAHIEGRRHPLAGLFGFDRG